IRDIFQEINLVLLLFFFAAENNEIWHTIKNFLQGFSFFCLQSGTLCFILVGWHAPSIACCCDYSTWHLELSLHLLITILAWLGIGLMTLKPIIICSKTFLGAN
ncbi:hypothetical protein ACJX0J_036330, partial [Zea mays]